MRPHAKCHRRVRWIATADGGSSGRTWEQRSSIATSGSGHFHFHNPLAPSRTRRSRAYREFYARPTRAGRAGFLVGNLLDPAAIWSDRGALSLIGAHHCQSGVQVRRWVSTPKVWRSRSRGGLRCCFGCCGSPGRHGDTSSPWDLTVAKPSRSAARPAPVLLRVTADAF